MSSLATLPEAAQRRSRPLRRRLRPLLHPAEQCWSALLVLAILCGFLFFYGLNAGALYRTEALRAIIGAGFLRSGNWVVPTLYGDPLFTKPPGHYAAIALCSWPFGEVSTWSARLPSALAATATVFLFYWYFARQLGRRAGLLAAVMLPMSPMWLDKAPSAEIDMLQVAWVSAAVLFFLRALEEYEKPSLSPCHRVTVSPCHRAACRWWLLALLCVAGGFLTKWTAPAFFYLTVVPLLWWRGRLRLLFGWPHLLGLAVAAGLGLAWIGAAVAMTRWELFLETVGREGLMRLSPSHHHRPYPWHETLGRPFVILATGLPWSVFALVALRPSFARHWDERGRRLLQALHCWAWPNLLFWTVLPGHAVRYTLPLFPAVSGLAALVWISWLRKQEGAEEQPRRTGLRAFLSQPSTSHVLGMVVFWVAIKLVFVHAVMPLRNVTRQPRAKAAALASLVPPGVTLYLFNTKDEGIMFYCGRPVRRLHDVSQIPSSGEPVYCILTEAEWQQWGPELPAEVIAYLRDEQRALIVLIRVGGTRP